MKIHKKLKEKSDEETVIFGCTKIGPLLRPKNFVLPDF